MRFLLGVDGAASGDLWYCCCCSIVVSAPLKINIPFAGFSSLSSKMLMFSELALNVSSMSSLRPSSSMDLLLLLTPRGGAVRFLIRYRGSSVWFRLEVVVVLASRLLRRGFSGLAMWASGGDGSCEWPWWPGEEEMRLWRLRQELMRFPIALWVEAGLEGGVKSEAWSRGCDESQEKADGRSIFGKREQCAAINCQSQVSCVVVKDRECICDTQRSRCQGAQAVCDRLRKRRVCMCEMRWMECAGLNKVARHRNRARQYGRGVAKRREAI